MIQRQALLSEQSGSKRMPSMPSTGCSTDISIYLCTKTCVFELQAMYTVMAVMLKVRIARAVS